MQHLHPGSNKLYTHTFHQIQYNCYIYSILINNNSQYFFNILYKDHRKGAKGAKFAKT